MEFGLWIEPEMVNPDSDLYRAHPDWALHIAGRPLQTAIPGPVENPNRSMPPMAATATVPRPSVTVAAAAVASASRRSMRAPSLPIPG